MEKYVDFTIVSYALADCIIALNNCGVKEFVITKEDNDLHIRIAQKHLEQVVYKIEYTSEKIKGVNNENN